MESLFNLYEPSGALVRAGNRALGRRRGRRRPCRLLGNQLSTPKTHRCMGTTLITVQKYKVVYTWFSPSSSGFHLIFTWFSPDFYANLFCRRTGWQKRRGPFSVFWERWPNILLQYAPIYSCVQKIGFISNHRCSKMIRVGLGPSRMCTGIIMMAMMTVIQKSWRILLFSPK